MGAQTQTILTRHKNDQSHVKELDEKMEKLLLTKGVTPRGKEWNFSTVPQERAKQISYFNALMRKRNEIVGRWNAKGFYDHGWEELAKELDAVIDKRLGGSSRPFSNIMAVRCINRTEKQFQRGTAADFANAVVSDIDFSPGRAILLSAGLRVGVGERGGQITGHAIAGHFKSDSELYLFDPNHGIFLSNSRGDFRKALEILMGDAWRATNWHLDGTFGYAIFRNSAASTEKKPAERPVDYSASSSPSSLTMQNVALGTIPTLISSSQSAPPPGKSPKPAAQRFAPQGSPKTIAQAKRGGRVADLAQKFAGK